MIVAINYSDRKYKEAQKFNSMTAVTKGKADKVISYSPKDIDAEFKRKNEKILRKKRGAGYWLWKPYIIQKTLRSMRNGDYLVYLDSGAFYINNVRHLIKQMEKDAQYIMAFEIPFRECHWTKRDVFICMGCDEPQYAETNQRMGGIIVIKKTEKAEQFVDDWLKYGQMGELITDAKNMEGEDNYVGFVENRHDQSIFSLLTKKYKIRAYEDPSQYGRFPDIYWGLGGHRVKKRKCNCAYPQIVALHKIGKVTRRVYWEQMFFTYAPRVIVNFYITSGLYDMLREILKLLYMKTD